MVAAQVAERGARFSPEQVAAHEQMLEERVFQVESKWPQFRRMLDDLKALASEMPSGSTVVCLERTLLYGGYSLFAPLFPRQDFVSIDCSPGSANERGAYNAAMVDDERFVPVPTTRRAAAEATGLADASVDLVLVPNLVHHVQDQTALFSEMARILKPGGRGYIFEPLVRELHQMPDDYVRYTPWGFQSQLEAVGLSYDRYLPEGGPFTAIAYCWTQALEYFPEDMRAEMERWFYDEHFKKLRKWDAAYGERNLKRQHTTFPTAFGIFFHRP